MSICTCKVFTSPLPAGTPGKTWQDRPPESDFKPTTTTNHQTSQTNGHGRREEGGGKIAIKQYHHFPAILPAAQPNPPPPTGNNKTQTPISHTILLVNLRLCNVRSFLCNNSSSRELELSALVGLGTVKLDEAE